MKKALIVSSSENSASEISLLLRSAGFDKISIISSGKEGFSGLLQKSVLPLLILRFLTNSVRSLQQ